MVALSKARAFRQMLFLDIGILTKYVNPRLHDLIQFLGALHFTLLQAAPFFPPYKQNWEEKQISVIPTKETLSLFKRKLIHFESGPTSLFFLALSSPSPCSFQKMLLKEDVDWKLHDLIYRYRTLLCF